MDSDKLKRANSLQAMINQLTARDIPRLEHACSERFERRGMLINIFGSRQDDGISLIPESISKEVCNIILLSLKADLQRFTKEFDSI